MNKKILILIILAIIIVVLSGVLIFLPKKANNTQKPVVVEGIQIISPKENEEIASPLKISGSINGGGWSGFEGQVGTVKLLDNKGKQLGEISVLKATTDWTSSSVSFEATLNFTAAEAQNGVLVFSNENASGLPEKDKQFAVPVKIPETKTTEVKVFFGNMALSSSGEQDECKRVYAVKRYIEKTEGVAKATIEELLKGLTEQEKAQGYFTNINSGVKLNSISIIKTNPPSATVDFDEQLEKGVGGSCKVASIRAQITETLKQFPTIEKVTISINGRTEDILQP